MVRIYESTELTTKHFRNETGLRSLQEPAENLPKNPANVVWLCFIQQSSTFPSQDLHLNLGVWLIA